MHEQLKRRGDTIRSRRPSAPDLVLVDALIGMNFLSFGRSLKNRNDSQSCLGRPRRLLASAEINEYVSTAIANLIIEKCASRSLMGVSSSGIAWAQGALLMARVKHGIDMRMQYVRKEAEVDGVEDLIAGMPPDEQRNNFITPAVNRDVVLIDDLLFVGDNKDFAIEVLHRAGYRVRDVVVIIDRQLQRRDRFGGRRLQDKWGFRLHRLCTMDQIVSRMIDLGQITDEQLAALRADYRRYARWELPAFTT